MTSPEQVPHTEVEPSRRRQRPDGTGFYLASGELTVAGVSDPTLADAGRVDFSVTAGLFGGVDTDLVLASWNTAQTAEPGTVRSEGGRTVLPLQTEPLMLNSLPTTMRVQLRTEASPHDAEGDWELVLHFRNHTGSSLTWHARLPAEAFGAGWPAPLADLLTIDGIDGVDGIDGIDGTDAADDEPAPSAESASASPAVTVIHHSDDEYYELLVDGRQAGLLVYHVIGSNLSITHTVIEPSFRGRGLSWALVGRALDDIRTKSVTVSNYCPVVSRFVEQNPEYRDLVSS
ncbi:GNAT family N-acetyltransferase [Kribbella sp. NPDC051586]|uniref:GNAT family N-acetyltransferase n=1 Tax=Kribbella sp. NPDC051586 TaxID=3364118 RepID=UPI00378B27DF